MIAKAKTLPADEVFLDLEDAVAADAKSEAREQVAAALAEPGWGDQLRGVRVNDWTTPWTHADVIERPYSTKKITKGTPYLYWVDSSAPSNTTGMAM